MKTRLGLLFAVAVLVFGLSVSYAEDKAQEEVNYPGDIVYQSTGEPVVFSHSLHVSDFGYGCDACHSKLFEVKTFAAREKGDFNMRALDEGRYCGGCHNGNTAFASSDFEQCARCHSGEAAAKAKNAGQRAKGPRATISLGSDDSVAEFRHSMHGFLSCDKCHTSLFPMKKTSTITSMDEINGGKSCGSCHDGKTAFDPSDCHKCHPKM